MTRGLVEQIVSQFAGEKKIAKLGSMTDAELSKELDKVTEPDYDPEIDRKGVHRAERGDIVRPGDVDPETAGKLLETAKGMAPDEAAMAREEARHEGKDPEDIFSKMTEEEPQSQRRNPPQNQRQLPESH